MPNYQQGRIYKIEASDSLPYIGSTTQSLCSRLSGHKRHHKHFVNTGKGGHCRSFDLLIKTDYTITLIEMFPCNSKEELFARERHWINIIPCINKARPTITTEEHSKYQQQYYIDNKDLLITRSNNYYHANKEKISEKRKERYQQKKYPQSKS
jgi:hypothetical protein